MPRLVIKPGSAAAWEIHLKPGPNLIGRGASNDFLIPDDSVSGTHCEIQVNDHSAILKDLSSTNGTFVNGTLTAEAELKPGQTIHLGSVELTYLSDEQSSPYVRQTVAARPEFSAEATPAVVEAPRTTRIPLPTETDPSAASSMVVGARTTDPANCRFHPKTFGRFFCSHCGHYFCELCVTSRVVSGKRHKYCRHCGVKCQPVQVRLQPRIDKGFFQRLPAAFLYPLRGAGVLIVIAGIVLLVVLKAGRSMMQIGSFRAMAFGTLLEIFAGGYLFTYLQGIVHSTIAQDRELPDLPWISNFAEDVVVPFFRLFGLFVCCFIPALAVGIWAGISAEPTGPMAFLIALGFGAIYFPMAFLAVAVLDSITAANPLLVVPSIVKAPGEYLMCLVPLACSSAAQSAGGLLMKTLFPDGWLTHSMGTLLGMVSIIALTSFLSFYLIILSVHLLGLFYLTKEAKLGWLSRQKRDGG